MVTPQEFFLGRNAAEAGGEASMGAEAASFSLVLQFEERWVAPEVDIEEFRRCLSVLLQNPVLTY